MTGHSRLSEAQEALFERAYALGHDVLSPWRRRVCRGRSTGRWCASSATRVCSGTFSHARAKARPLSSASCVKGWRTDARRPRRHSRSRAWAATRFSVLRSRRFATPGSTRLAAGEAVAAFALSEPEAGSDAAALALRAERAGDGFPA